MASQVLRAWAVDHEALFAVVGSKDESFIAKVLARKNEVEDLDEFFQEDYDTTVEEILRELVCGDLDPRSAGEYRRVLEVVAPVVGKSAGPEADVPGRGWQDEELAAWLELANLPRLAAVWKVEAPFPWRTWPKTPERPIPATFDWPKARFIARSDHDALAKELAKFDIAKAPSLPERQEGCEPDADYLLQSFRGWLRDAKGTDLVVLHDGQQ
jgi:hypothetical protein